MILIHCANAHYPIYQIDFGHPELHAGLYYKCDELEYPGHWTNAYYGPYPDLASVREAAQKHHEMLRSL